MYNRIPRKLKKELMKKGEDYKQFLSSLNIKLERDSHIDVLFNKDYSDVHDLIHKSING